MTDSAIETSEAPAKQSGRPTLLDWLIEAVVLFGAAYFLGPWLSEWASQFNIAFRASIYWAPVVLLAVRYGLVSGLVAALIATGLFLLAHPATEPAIGETLLASSLRVGIQPLAWTVAAAVLGGMRTRAQEAEARLRQDLATETRTVEILAERYIRLRDRVESLERALAVGTAPALRRAGQRVTGLADLPADQCRDRLYEILSAGANGAQISLYLRAGGEKWLLPPKSRRSRTTDLPPAAIFPIRNARGSELGEVQIERIDPEHFTEADQDHYAGLCDRVGDILDQRGINDLIALMRADMPQ